MWFKWVIQLSVRFAQSPPLSVRPPLSVVVGPLSKKPKPRLDSLHPVVSWCWCTLRVNYTCNPQSPCVPGLPSTAPTTRVRDSVRESDTERLCHRFLTVCHSRCSLSAETISINAGKRGEEGDGEAEMWKSEKDGHKAWQHPSLLLFFLSGSFPDIVIHWAACSSAPVSPVGVGQADIQYLLKWSRGDSCESLLLGCSLKRTRCWKGF